MTYSDKKVEQMAKRLRRDYRRATKELQAKFLAEFKRIEEESAPLLNAIQTATTAKQKAAAVKAYSDFVQKNALTARWYKEMIDDMTFRIANVNAFAIDYINGQMPDIYAYHLNWINEDIHALVGGYSFDLVDERTVQRLFNSGELWLPKKKLDPLKDIPWNRQKLNGEIMQGILQGESIPKMADRVAKVVATDYTGAVRTARTMTTCCENRGRLDGVLSAQDQGIIIKKVWLAAHDGRVRDSHKSVAEGGVSGEERFPEERFSNKLLYPGDPSGAPSEVYNCRCTLTYNILGFAPIGGKNG